MCELGRVDINTEISMLTSFSVAPRQGHLAAVLHSFAYLKQHSESKMVFDPSKMDHPPVPNCDWAAFHQDAKEMIHPMLLNQGATVRRPCASLILTMLVIW